MVKLLIYLCRQDNMQITLGLDRPITTGKKCRRQPRQVKQKQKYNHKAQQGLVLHLLLLSMTTFSFPSRHKHEHNIERGRS